MSSKLPTIDEIDAERSRRSLAAYGEYVHGKGPARHHQVWIEALPQFDKLLIEAPFDHAKTQWVGINYPAWVIGNNPNVHIGYISNTARQAQSKSVAVRDTIAYNEKYHLVFPNISPDRDKGWAEYEWYVKRDDPGDKDSTFSAAGVGGPILGVRFDLLIFDDIADQENQATVLQRTKVIDWIEQTAMTRLVPGGKAILICTRWHHQDPAAWARERGWAIIHQPAIQEDGSALWPERYPIERLQQLQAENPLLFERSYQGNPTIQEGTLFKAEWWQYYETPPESTYKIIVIDTAFKTGQGNDFSVIATWGRGDRGAYLLSLWKGRVEYPELKRMTLSIYQRELPNVVIIEDAASGQSLLQDLQKTTILPLRPYRPDKDKVARANSVLDFVASGRVFLPERAPWLGEFIREHSEFPLGDHDDIVDTTTMALRVLLGQAEPKIRWL